MAWYKKIPTVIAAIFGGVEMLEKILKKWGPRVRDWWNGKKIAVLGPTAAGKNSLYNRLQGRSIPAEHAQTRGAETVQNFKFAFALPDGSQFAISCKRASNVGGERDERDRYWSGACDGADVIFYMLTIRDLEERAFQAGTRINDDLKWLGGSASSYVASSPGTSPRKQARLDCEWRRYP